MSILGLGTDIIRIDRIGDLVDRYGDRFLNRVFRDGELAVMERTKTAAMAALAARWAAKEAFVKALGDLAEGVPYRDVEVVRSESGAPQLRLHAAAAQALASKGATGTLVSLSHEQDHATATVILL